MPSRLRASFVHMLRALRHRNYRLYFFGQGLSLIGTWMTMVATSWLVYRLTNSPALLGLVGFAGQIPGLLFAPFAGVLVDRWDRRRLLVITQVCAMLQSLTLAVLALTHTITIPQIIALSALQGVINAFDIPARQAFLIELIEPHDLSNAIALNSSVFNGARLIGPSIAGVIIASAGEGACFLVDAISYLAVVAALGAMHLAGTRTSSVPRRPLLRELRDGMAYAYGFAPIRAILLLTALVSFMGIPYAVLMPVFAKEILHGGAHTFGFLVGASGLGALVGALYLASRKSVVGLGRVIAWMTTLFGASLIAFAMSRTVWLSLVFMFGIGFGMLTQMAAGNTILQTVVDEDKRGRVMSLYAMAFMGMMPFGSLLGGGLASRIGAPNTLWIGGGVCLLGACVFARALPRIRELARPIYVRKGILPDVAASSAGLS